MPNEQPGIVYIIMTYMYMQNKMQTEYFRCLLQYLGARM